MERGERIAERVGGSLEFRVESSFSISLRKRPCGSSGEGRGRPPCLTAYLRCMGVQVARCCSGRHGVLPLQFSGWDYCNPAILSLHSPLSTLLILIQFRGVDLRDARGLDVSLVGCALDGELRSTAIACRELLAVNIEEYFAGTRVAGL